MKEDEETKKVTCHALFSPQTKIKPEDFADGSLLKEAIHHYLEDPEGDALFDLMQILRDCDVWIPCSAVIGEEDQEAMEKMIEEAGDDLESMVGKEITAQDNIRLVPDILENDGKYFFPAFASEEDMGEYGEGFSQIQESFMTVMDLARTTQHEGKDLTGIVINAFTEPFVLPKELFKTVERMVSRIE